MNTSTRSSDVQRAKDWLKSWPQRWFAIEEVQREVNLDIGTPALAGKFRLARQRGELESRVREGKTYKEYHYNPAYKPLPKAKDSPTFYFFTLKNSPVASPYMASIEAILNSPFYSKGCKIWTGSFERPYPVKEK